MRNLELVHSSDNVFTDFGDANAEAEQLRRSLLDGSPGGLEERN